MLRTSKVGLFATARLATPFYDLGKQGYATPVTFNLSMSFL